MQKNDFHFQNSKPLLLWIFDRILDFNIKLGLSCNSNPFGHVLTDCISLLLNYGLMVTIKRVVFEYHINSPQDFGPNSL